MQAIKKEKAGVRRILKGIRVLLGPSTFGALDQTPLHRLKETGCKVIENPYKRTLSKNELMKLLAGGVEGLIAGLEPLDAEVLKKTQLKVISRCGAGVSNVDLTAAKRLNIEVCSTPDAPTQAVAELTLGAMLSLFRMIPQMSQDLHSGKWSKRIGRQLEGKTVVIVGFGRIGQKLASLLLPFNVKIIAVDLHIVAAYQNVEYLPIERALPRADVVSIHCTGEKQVLGAREFELLKDGAFILNASRGGVIDERILIRYLDKGKVAGAWIDTFIQEPYNGPLMKYPQVILTPHVGSYTLETRRVMELEAVNNLIRVFQKIQNV